MKCVGMGHASMPEVLGDRRSSRMARSQSFNPNDAFAVEKIVMDGFKISLKKALGDAIAYANGYEVERYYGDSELTIDLADEQQLTMNEQEVVVDECGEAVGFDCDGVAVDFKFQMSVPYRPVEMMRKPLVTVLMGDDGQDPEVAANISLSVLVLRQGSDVVDAEKVDRFEVKNRSVSSANIQVTGSISVLQLSREEAAWVESTFDSFRVNRESCTVSP